MTTVLALWVSFRQANIPSALAEPSKKKLYLNFANITYDLQTYTSLGK